MIHLLFALAVRRVTALTAAAVVIGVVVRIAVLLRQRKQIAPSRR